VVLYKVSYEFKGFEFYLDKKLFLAPNWPEKVEDVDAILS